MKPLSVTFDYGPAGMRTAGRNRQTRLRYQVSKISSTRASRRQNIPFAWEKSLVKILTSDPVEFISFWFDFFACFASSQSSRQRGTVFPPVAVPTNEGLVFDARPTSNENIPVANKVPTAQTRSAIAPTRRSVLEKWGYVRNTAVPICNPWSNDLAKNKKNHQTKSIKKGS